MQAWEEIVYAREDGYEKGRNEGILRDVTAVCKKLIKGKSEEQIADELEQEPKYISRICHIAEMYAPDYNSNAIFQKLIADSI